MSSGDAALLRTPLYDAHVRLKGRMVPFGGWEMPVDYGSQISEHETVRNAVGIFDVSHMGQVRLRGERVLSFLAHLVPGNVPRLVDGASLYTAMCNDRGGTVDDLIVSRVAQDEVFAVVNASTRPNDVAWMRAKATALGFGEIDIADESDSWAMIAVQGPQALGVMEKLLPQKQWSETESFTLHHVQAEGESLIVSRTGYTGEDGVELLVPAARANEWWIKLLSLGAKPCGLGARDSLRLEMGYALYGQDLSEDISPLEGGIGWTVALRRPEKFVGREALEGQRAAGLPRVRIGVKLDSRKPLRHGDKVLAGGVEVGELTSGGFSPTLGVGIGLALVDRAKTEGREFVEISSRGKSVEAQVVKPPFIKR